VLKHSEKLKEEAEAAKQPKAKARAKDEPAEPPAAADSTAQAAITLLLQRIQQLEQQIEGLRPVDPIEKFGPPPPPRSARPQIRVYVTPDTLIRVEVPQSYLDSKQPGWDGTPVKGYVNHDNTLLTR
jgi:hypothetical protein